MLVASGADVNLRDVEGSTALHKAALAGHYDIILRLIQAKAEVRGEERKEEGKKSKLCVFISF